MADRITPEHRSWNMSRIRGKDTVPERTLRSHLHRAGYRFRLHDPGLPGRPDIVFRRDRIAVFVHGCFWHRHPGCRNTTTPSTRTEFWQNKFRQTVERDHRKESQLAAAGWRVLTVWECEIEANAEKAAAGVIAALRRSRR